VACKGSAVSTSAERNEENLGDSTDSELGTRRIHRQ
jgi:hypothetical protein